MDRKQRKKKGTPIIDGDARPDMPVDAGSGKPAGQDEKTANRRKFESERLSDVNSLEDYKDAKRSE